MRRERKNKKTVKFTDQEIEDYKRFLTHGDTRTWSRLIRRALYDYRKAQTSPARAPEEIQAADTDLADAKKLTESMAQNRPTKRGRPIGTFGTYTGSKPAEDKSDRRSTVGRKGGSTRKPSQAPRIRK